MANSIVDYVFRALGVEYLHRDELAQVPPSRPTELPEPPKGLAVEAGVQLDLTDASMEEQIEAQVEAARFADAPGPAGTAVEDSGAAPTVSPNGGGSNSNGSGKTAVATATRVSVTEDASDAPACPNCGNITMRSGSCHVCLTCQLRKHHDAQRFLPCVSDMRRNNRLQLSSAADR
jgi:ribonucleoside-diphosphate reductase alpha chain